MVADVPARGRYPGRGLHGQVVEWLGRRIAEGEPPPGEALPQEPVLAAEYDVSRTVVREALRVLAAKGMVDARPMRGTRVRPRREWRQLDPDLLRWSLQTERRDALVCHLLEIRLIVEPSAARLAAIRSGPELRERLAQALDALVGASGDPESYVEADLALHGLIFTMSSNPLLAELTAPIEAAMRQGRLVQVAGAGTGARRMAASLAAHRAVVDAIVDGDGARAEAAMRAVVDAAAADAERALRSVTREGGRV